MNIHGDDKIKHCLIICPFKQYVVKMLDNISMTKKYVYVIHLWIKHICCVLLRQRIQFFLTFKLIKHIYQKGYKTYGLWIDKKENYVAISSNNHCTINIHMIMKLINSAVDSASIFYLYFAYLIVINQLFQRKHGFWLNQKSLYWLRQWQFYLFSSLAAAK